MGGRRTRLIVRPGVALAAVLALASCSRNSLLESPVQGGGRESSQRIGSARVSYPGSWAVLDAAGRPEGWDWAANIGSDIGSDPAAPAQLAVDGDYSHLPSAELSVAQLLSAAQVGGLPGFVVHDQYPVDVPGAADAVRTDFTYQISTVSYQGVWVVACAQDSRSIAVQLTGTAPLDDTLVNDIVTGVAIIGDGRP